MQGRRLPATERVFVAGDYQKRDDGRGWNIRPPRGHIGWLSTEPGHHTVVEHEDGTITVSPSILHAVPHLPEESWHGYLERGVWREA
jgi:hypothetical protein